VSTESRVVKKVKPTYEDKPKRVTLTVKDLRNLVKGLKPDTEVYLSSSGMGLETLYKGEVRKTVIGMGMCVRFEVQDCKEEDKKPVIILYG
jgi:hypothetical protein